VSAGTLDRAVAEAQHLARFWDAVLLSPGCESFDQFADYRARGDRFAELVRALAPDITRTGPTA
jgi:UDP-N-acetylmuramoylalanine--D-glutamate ligase